MDAQQILRQKLEQQLGALLLTNLDQSICIEALEEEKADIKMELAQAHNQLATLGASPKEPE
jgi:hypothetical protein